MTKSLSDLLEELTPKRIVEELDKYIVGQDQAKKAVAIALRNRWRRQRLPEHIRDEVAPKKPSYDRPHWSWKDGDSKEDRPAY